MTQEELTAIARIEERMKSVDETVSDIKSRLYGNGKPGIIVDQANQNAQIDKLLTAAKQNADNIEKLSNITPPKWIARNWRNIGLAVVLGFMFLHSIIPANLSIWTAVEKLFIK